MTYKHFTVEERETIQQGLWEKESIRSIAGRLGRSASSVSREITRNRPPERQRYTPRVAHERAVAKRGSRGRVKRLKNARVRQYVIVHLKRRWSPEQIAGRIKRDLNEPISHEAIYQFIYVQVRRQGHGSLKPGATDFRPYLRRRRKRRLPFGTRRCQRVIQPKGPSIDTRPAVVDRRSRVGDWEGDTVESCQHKPGINTVVERKSGLVFMTHLANKTTAATIGALTQRFHALPQSVKHTLTLDNGFENGNWSGIEAATMLTCYFAHAYHSWERGTNENTNGLIRDYFPKKTDFTTIPTDELAHVERELNNRPRKRLGYLTPNEVFSVALQG
jgi:IS30 family transposase